MRNKKILFLGGAYSQIPAIKYAREQNLYIITVDYLPDNPGHKIANEYYNISTINKEQILDLAKKLKIDAISAYASDPAAPTAAYVAEEFNLIGNPFLSVEILSNKHLFRKFLRDNGFNAPCFSFSDTLDHLKQNYFNNKAILKPVDSSGSKGVFLIDKMDDLDKDFEIAKSYSRSGIVILEEYIDRKGPQIHGEGFIIKGEIVFMLLGDQVFSVVNTLAPYSTIVPSIFHKDILADVQEEIRSIIKLIGFQTGGINIEVIRDINNKIYILEIGARNGGNYMPQLMKYATGFDLVKANIDVLFNENASLHFKNPKKGQHYAQIILHSSKSGKLLGINIPTELQNNILEQNIYYGIGSKIQKYKNSSDVVGVIILQVNNDKEYNSFLKYLELNNWVITK